MPRLSMGRQARRCLDPGGVSAGSCWIWPEAGRRSPRAWSPPRPTSRSRPTSAAGSIGSGSSPVAPCRRLQGPQARSRPSNGRSRRRAGISSSASPRTICSCCWRPSAWPSPLFGERLLPVGTVYDPFIARGLDALNYACYQDARFLLVATPSGITLAPEGGAHQSIVDALDRHRPARPHHVRARLRRRAGRDPALCLRSSAAEERRLGLSAPLDPSDRAAEARDAAALAAVTSGAYWLREPAPGCGDRRHRHRRRAARGDRGGRSARRPAGARACSPSPPPIGCMPTGAAQAASPARPLSDHRSAAGTARARRRAGDRARRPSRHARPGSARRGARIDPLGVDRFGQSGDIPDLYRELQIDAAAILDRAALACRDAIGR